MRLSTRRSNANTTIPVAPTIHIKAFEFCNARFERLCEGGIAVWRLKPGAEDLSASGLRFDHHIKACRAMAARFALQRLALVFTRSQNTMALT